MSGTRSVVSFDARSSRPPDRRAVAVTPRSLESRTRSRRPLSSSIDLTVNRRPTSCDTGTQTFAVCVRAIVTRSAGGPAHVFRRVRDRRTRDAYDRLLPNPSNQSGTLTSAVSAPPASCEMRAGADGVSRRRCALRWSRLSLGRALSSRRVEWLEPRLTPLSLLRAETDSLRTA
jgi:hypothetical protein